MKQTAYIIIAVLLFGASLWGTQSVLAQDDSAGTQPERDAAAALTTTLTDLSYRDVNLEGLYGNASIWVPLRQPYELLDSVEVNVDYVASPLLREDVAVLTILANGRQVTSIHPDGDGLEHSFSVEIPTEVIDTSGFLLSFEGYLRISEDICEATSNPGQWLTIRRTTFVAEQLVEGAELTRIVPDLSSASQRFGAQFGTSAPPPMLFVTPDNPDNAILTTAARVAAYLGSGFYRAGELPFELVSISDLTQQQRNNAHLIVIGVPSQNPLLTELNDALPSPLRSDLFATEGNRALPPGHGVLQLLTSPFNPDRLVMVVSANGEAGVDLAGRALLNQGTVSSLFGQYAFIETLAPQTIDVATAWLTDQTSFSQLGYSDVRVSGTGVFDQFFRIQLPPGWQLESGSKLNMHMAFSTVLRQERSYADVILNDIYLGSVNSADYDSDIRVSFDLPVEAINASVNSDTAGLLELQVTIANLVPEGNCERLPGETVWATLYADSFLETPHTYVSQFDLMALPYPFVTDNAGTTVELILPPEPTLDEYEAALAVAAFIGRYRLRDLDLTITTADSLDEGSSDTHWIVIGSTERQPLLDDLIDEEDALPGPAFYREVDNIADGILQIVDRPDVDDYATLLVYSDTQAGVELAARGLYEGYTRNRSTTAAIVRQGAEPGSLGYIVLEELERQAAQATPLPPALPTTEPMDNNDSTNTEDETESGTAVDQATETSAQNTEVPPDREQIEESNIPQVAELGDQVQFIALSLTVALIVVTVIFAIVRLLTRSDS